MFWRVAGFAQPSPIETILDKEEYTLEELLDEDDIIQECKSLNGRLISFLREPATVEKLIRYLVESPSDTDDPKRQYKYPFTACEVLSCEVEAIFNTLLQDANLMRLLFSLLDGEAPLNSKAAGYFGRVVVHLLLRKTNETMAYLQANKDVLEKLINHIDTTSIADIFKRLVGADDQASTVLLPNHLSWLADTPLVELLLQRFGPEYRPEVQQNAADILTAIAHTQPSPIALKLTREQSIAHLFQHALAPDGRVLVSALDVCIALLEPRRHVSLMPVQMEPGSPKYDMGNLPSKKEAVEATLKHIDRLVKLLDAANPQAVQETPYGMLQPPLGTARLKLVELLAVLLRSGEESAEQAIIKAGAVPKCLELFVAYPFNNLLHHHVTAMLLSGINSSSKPIIDHLFGDCKVADWLMNIPIDCRPLPRPGTEESSAKRPPLRAGYMGHITHLAQRFQETTNKDVLRDSMHAVAAYIDGNAGWQRFWAEKLEPRLEVESIMRWACGRPQLGDININSEEDDYQNEMDLEQIQGMQVSLYHRYEGMAGVDDDDEDEDQSGPEGGVSSSGKAQALEDVMGNLNIHEEEDYDRHMHTRSLPESHKVEMDDDQVLMDDDHVVYDEEELNPGSQTPSAAAAPTTQPDTSDPVPAPTPASSQNLSPSSDGTIRAFPLDQVPDAEQTPAPAQENSLPKANPDADAAMAPATANGVVAGTAASGGKNENGVSEDKEGTASESKEFNDAVFWKASLHVEVPEDV